MLPEPVRSSSLAPPAHTAAQLPAADCTLQRHNPRRLDVAATGMRIEIEAGLTGQANSNTDAAGVHAPVADGLAFHADAAAAGVRS